MKECLLDNVDIIEIGGGYGGLCFFIRKLASLFELTVRSYTIFDLEEPSKLQKKYLENMGYFDTNFRSENLQKNSFLISNYAFSGIPMYLQKQYTNNVLNPYTSHGFLAWNLIDVYAFVADKNISIEPEVQSTGIKNKYVRFKPFEFNGQSGQDLKHGLYQ
jgi:hypothetical protein